MKVQATKSKISATISTNANLITLERAHGVRISSKNSSHLITKTSGVKKISHRILLTFLWFNNWVYPQTWAFHKILLLSSGSNMKITTTSSSIFSLSLTSTFPKISSNWPIKVINSLNSYLQQIIGSTLLQSSAPPMASVFMSTPSSSLHQYSFKDHPCPKRPSQISSLSLAITTWTSQSFASGQSPWIRQSSMKTIECPWACWMNRKER